MFNINKNNTLEVLQQLVENNISQKLSYMPESFNEQQKGAIELFRKRIFLEKIVEESIAFNKKIIFPNENKNIHLATTAESLVEVFQLRSEVYTTINYQDEFPDTIEGLNFDKYDSNSAILFYRTEKTVTGTIRVVIDSQKKLPSENNFSFEKIRDQYSNISEMSRFIVNKKEKGLGLEFKYLFRGVYHLFMNNQIDIILSGLKREHYKLYSKFGGVHIEEELKSYGSFSIPCLILSWDPSKVSPFFKKVFLK